MCIPPGHHGTASRSTLISDDCTTTPPLGPCSPDPPKETPPKCQAVQGVGVASVDDLARQILGALPVTGLLPHPRQAVQGEGVAEVDGLLENGLSAHPVSGLLPCVRQAWTGGQGLVSPGTDISSASASSSGRPRGEVPVVTGPVPRGPRRTGHDVGQAASEIPVTRPFPNCPHRTGRAAYNRNRLSIASSSPRVHDQEEAPQVPFQPSTELTDAEGEKAAVRASRQEQLYEKQDRRENRPVDAAESRHRNIREACPVHSGVVTEPIEFLGSMEMHAPTTAVARCALRDVGGSPAVVTRPPGRACAVRAWHVGY